jgi:hypothetical protein
VKTIASSCVASAGRSDRHDLHQGRDDDVERRLALGDLGGEPIRRLARARQQQGGPGPRIGIVSHRAECYLPETRLTTHRTCPLEPRRLILGLESSCDDTAAAVLRGSGEAPEILSSIVIGQAELHAEYGGVVPEIAARAHAERLDRAVEAALEEAGVALRSVDAIAVTAGPGLIGGVLSGVMTAKGLAMGLGKPLIGVNHLAGHALTPRLTDGARFPYLLLLVSGGHCQILRVDDWNEFTAWRHHRRRAGRGLRQGRAASGTAATGGTRDRGGGAQGRSDTVRLPPPAAGQGRVRHVLFRPQDGRPARPGPAARKTRAG